MKASVFGTGFVKPLGIFGLNPELFGGFWLGGYLGCCIRPRYPTQKPFPSFHQVQQRVPQPEHGSEETGANAAGLQAPAVQGGEIRGEGEDRPRPRQAAPGTEVLTDPNPKQGRWESPGVVSQGLGKSWEELFSWRLASMPSPHEIQHFGRMPFIDVKSPRRAIDKKNANLQRSAKGKSQFFQNKME